MRGVIAAMIIAAGALAAARWVVLRDSVEAGAALRTIAPREGRPGGYVSSDACRACHPAEHASWHRTYHRTMTQLATPETVQGDFAGVTVTVHGETYRMTRVGDEFWMNAPDPRATPAAPLRLDARVYMLTGSHNQQAYWLLSGSPEQHVLYIAPLIYLIAEKRWVPRDDVFLVAPEIRDARAHHPVFWNLVCIECHATAGQKRPREAPDTGTIWADSQVAELGIACESCHGPAEAHVRANQDPVRRFQLHASGASDATIVNPARLSAQASSQICGACHGIQWYRDQSDYEEHGNRFRPGKPEQPSAILVRPRQLAAGSELRAEIVKQLPMYFDERFWSDGLARTSGRELNGIIESRCYEGGELSCLSCHALHDSAPDDQLRARMDGDEACLQCHASLRERPEAHTHHRAGSTGSACMNCHMPHTTYGLLKAIRSHTIDIPSVATNVATGRPNACNLCHLDKTLAWTAETMTGWYGTEPVELSFDHQSTAAAALWLLRGDAGLRALAAWSFGWAPAQQASGTDWLAPLLALTLDDPYPAVRFVAGRSLRSLPRYLGFPYDYVADAGVLAEAKQQALQLWTDAGGARANPDVLVDSGGQLAQERVDALRRDRDERWMNLME